jgi:Phosphodiester glycosidase
MTRRTFFSSFSFLLIALVTIPTITTAAPPAPKRQIYKRTLAKGVEFIQEIRVGGDKDGPQIISVIKINPNENGVKLEAALGQDDVWSDDATQGREIVSKIVKRRGALIGINTGFFPFAGNPIGLHIENGNFVTEPTLNRSFFGQTNKKESFIGAFSYQGKINIAAGNEECSYKIAGLNRKPGKGNELLLFTPIFAAKTLKMPNRTEVILEGLPEKILPNTDYTGTIKTIIEGGETPLAPSTVVLSGGGDAGNFLKNHPNHDQKIQFRLECLPAQPDTTVKAEELVWGMAGGPRILTQGKIDVRLEPESMGEAFSITRHPRTAMGITRKGEVLLVTVDGRQAGLSRGVSLPELAQILLEYGAWDGVNMDGGGSTTMSLRGGLLNSPSEGIERPVANMLLLYAPDLNSELNNKKLSLTLPAQSKTLAVGETLKLTHKENKNGVWTVNGGTGFMTQSGLFHATRPGKAIVRFQWGSKENQSVQTEITITDSGPLRP